MVAAIAREQLAAFRAFIDRGRSLLPTKVASAPLDPFRRFVDSSKPLLLRELPTRLAAVRPKMHRLKEWLLPSSLDLLRVAGLTYDENAYTRLMAWSLAPATDPQSALARQSEWLRALAVPQADCLREPAKPKTQVLTGDGRPDLVLEYADLAVVVEAKTGSYEHSTPASGEPQTVSYPPAVREHLGLEQSVPIHMVFLTPDGRAAASEEAICATYLELAVALASALEPSRLSEDLRILFKAWITHLATCAVPPGVDFLRVLEAVAPPAEQGGADAETRILASLTEINQLLTLLPMRTENARVQGVW